MYVTVSQAPVDVFLTYVVILVSCGLLYPFIRVIFGALGKGLSRWR